MGRKKGPGPVALIILFLIGAVFLGVGIYSIVGYAGLMIEAKNYVPKEFSIIDEENILQQKDEIKDAFKKYCEKNGVSYDLVVFYCNRGETGSGYSLKREELSGMQYTDPYEFLNAYSSENNLISDDRSLVLGMVYDGRTGDLIEFVHSIDRNRGDSHTLEQSQSGLQYFFEKKVEQGQSPEQAVINVINENLWRVSLYVPIAYDQYRYSDATRAIMASSIFLVFGVTFLGVFASVVIKNVKSRSPKSFEDEADPMHDAMEWYQNKPSRSAPPPDRESSSYYSDLFGGGREKDEE